MAISELIRDDARNDLGQMLHELRQPLNVVSLSAGNLRSRLGAELSEEQAAYLHSRLDRIAEQVERASLLLDRMAERLEQGRKGGAGGG
ncbi:MAG: hypothetical protein JSS36_02390 [Proteobacteria bacterium]|nr:hypothetical protein [Pseudomonadota bacterium]